MNNNIPKAQPFHKQNICHKHLSCSSSRQWHVSLYPCLSSGTNFIHGVLIQVINLSLTIQSSDRSKLFWKIFSDSLQLVVSMCLVKISDFQVFLKNLSTHKLITKILRHTKNIMYFANLTKIGIILIHSHWTVIVVLAVVIFFYLTI